VIWLFGELAAHVFVPAYPGTTAISQPVQFGGGVGMMARHLAAAGENARLVALTGADTIGVMLRAAVPSGIHAEHRVDTSARTSTVFLRHDRHSVTDVSIDIGGADITLAVDAASALAADDLAYVPAFPGHEEIVTAVAGSSAQTVVDFGFAPWGSEAEVVAARLRELPAGGLAQISGGDLDLPVRLRLLEVALEHGYPAAVVTGGSGTTIGCADSERFEVPARPVTPLCTIGCGDVLIAETLRALSGGDTLEKACNRGCEAARAKALRWGIEE
jgi:fructokinase